MKATLQALTGVMLCGITPMHVAAEPALSLQSNPGELHAVVTDMPHVNDMSHADPRTWHSLPPAAHVYDDGLAQEVEFPTHFSSRARPF